MSQAMSHDAIQLLRALFAEVEKNPTSATLHAKLRAMLQRVRLYHNQYTYDMRSCY